MRLVSTNHLLVPHQLSGRLLFHIHLSTQVQRTAFATLARGNLWHAGAFNVYSGRSRYCEVWLQDTKPASSIAMGVGYAGAEYDGSSCVCIEGENF